MGLLIFTVMMVNIVSKRNLEKTRMLTYTDDIVLAFVNPTEISGIL
jgi:hypothetical protein